MTDPEICFNILRDENELHIYIDHLAHLTPHEVADLLESVSGILRTLPDKPLKYISAADPEIKADKTSSHETKAQHQITRDFWN